MSSLLFLSFELMRNCLVEPLRGGYVAAESAYTKEQCYGIVALQALPRLRRPALVRRSYATVRRIPLRGYTNVPDPRVSDGSWLRVRERFSRYGQRGRNGDLYAVAQ